MPDVSVYCPACGEPVATPRPMLGKTGMLADNLAGALAYLFIPAALFLLVEPYRKNRFIRFHSLQSLLVALAGVVAVAVLRLLSLVLHFIPVLGEFVILLGALVVFLGGLVLWVVLVIKALQGEMFKLPFLGDLAEAQASLRS
jgi:uncharacterized membrane protein